MEQSVELSGATVRYRSVGDGPVVVFVHGVWVTGHVWDDVVTRLPDARCIVPTWPLGAHADPAPGAELSAAATARRIPELLEALDLQDVTVVANDTGGGLTLASLATGHPGLERIRSLVFTNCDSYEHFPPRGFGALVAVARRVPRLGTAMLWSSATSVGQRLFIPAVCKRPVDRERVRSIFGAFATSKATRRDALAVTRSLHKSLTLEAVPALRAFAKPVRLVWGADDFLFPVSHAERLAADFPDAQLRVVPDARTFVMLDDPDAVAETIAELL